MTVHIAFLRAVNVGGLKSILMAELRGLLSELGFDGVRASDAGRTQESGVAEWISASIG